MNQVSIIASAFHGNKGAASMLEAAVQLLDRGNHRVGLLSMYPKEDSDLAPSHVEVFDARPFRLALSIVPLSALYRVAPPLRSLISKAEPAVPFVAESDLFLDQGGITFSDGREKFLIYNVATLLPALVLDVPVVKCAQAIGPFRGKLNRTVAKLVLPRMKTTVARGQATFEMLTELGLKNVTPGVDMAFSVTPHEETVDRMRAMYPELVPDGGLTVGVCPSQVAAKQLDAAEGPGTYAKVVSSVILDLLADGTTVSLIPHSFRADLSKTHNNDLPLCADIINQVGDHPHFVPVTEELSALELRAVIGLTDMLITSRFHGMVSALAAGVPPLVFGWGHKYREVLSLFSMKDTGLDVKQLTDSALVEQKIEEVLSSLDERESKIADALPEIVRESSRHGAIFEEAMGKDKAGSS